MITELPEMWWADFGACRGMYASLSFWAPTSDLNYQKAENSHERRVREAACKSICYTCPVEGECLAWALEHNEMGVWGGATDEERHAIRRRLARLVDRPRIG